MTVGSLNGKLVSTPLNADGVAYADAAGVIQNTTVGNVGEVLTSNGSGVAPTFQAVAGGSFVGFSAFLSSPTASVTGDGTIYQIIFDTENYDVGGNYNNATGVFTAPTTNYYVFGCAVRGFGTLTTTNGNLFIYVNGASQGLIDLHFIVLNPTQEIYTGKTFPLLLTAGDTVAIQIATANAGLAKDFYVDGGAVGATLTTFYGYKIG